MSIPVARSISFFVKIAACINAKLLAVKHYVHIHYSRTQLVKPPAKQRKELQLVVPQLKGYQLEVELREARNQEQLLGKVKLL